MMKASNTDCRLFPMLSNLRIINRSEKVFQGWFSITLILETKVGDLSRRDLFLMRSYQFQTRLQNCMMWVGQSDQWKTLSHLPLESVGETPDFI